MPVIKSENFFITYEDNSLSKKAYNLYSVGIFSNNGNALSNFIIRITKNYSIKDYLKDESFMEFLIYLNVIYVDIIQPNNYILTNGNKISFHYEKKDSLLELIKDFENTRLNRIDGTDKVFYLDNTISSYYNIFTKQLYKINGVGSYFEIKNNTNVMSIKDTFDVDGIHFILNYYVDEEFNFMKDYGLLDLISLKEYEISTSYNDFSIEYPFIKETIINEKKKMLKRKK